jgi:membrane protein DedA with SNARE-associated domain
LVDHLLQSIPPISVYLIVAGVIMIESLGIPIPGEVALISAAILSSRHEVNVSPGWIAVGGSAGAIIGDSIGFGIGHRYGERLFTWLGGKFPSHFGPRHVMFAERVFKKHGVWAVFFGRFIALLRIFAGPLAGSLRMQYLRFLGANASGGIVWATGTTYLIYYVGKGAEKWLSRFSYIGLIAAVVIGLAVSLIVKRKTGSLIDAMPDDEQPVKIDD